MSKDEEHWRVVSNIHYYLREGYYGTAILLCEGRQRQTKDTCTGVLKGVAYTLLGKIPEATRHLEGCRNDGCSLGALYALKWAHSCAFNPDHQSLMEIESEISAKTRDEKTSAESFASAAEVMYYNGELIKAKQLLDNALRIEKDAKYYCLMGWVELALGRDQKSTQKMFEKASSMGYPDGYVGRCRLLEGHHAGSEMKAIAKELTITSYQFVPGHIERCKAALMMREWTNAIDSLHNSNVNESSNPFIEFLRAVHAVCFAGYSGGLTTTLSILQRSLDENEADNHALLAKIAGSLAKLCAKDRNVLVFSKNLLARALQLSRRPAYLAEALRVSISLEDIKEVTALAKELVTLDVDNAYAALGLVISLLMAGRVNDARSQYEVVHEAHQFVKSSPIYYVVGAVFSKQRNEGFEVFRQQLTTALEMHQNSVQSIPFGVDHLSAMDSDLLFLIAQQILDFAPLVPVKAPDECLKMAEKVLSMIVDSAPGLAHVTYVLARVRYLCMNYTSSDELIKQCLEKNESFTEGYLLRAQMILDRGGKINDVEHALTTGLNFNFAVRDTSLYHLIKAKTLKRKGDNEDAVQTLRSALKIPPKDKTRNLLAPKEATDTHKISVQLELIDTLQQMKRMKEAEQVMLDALKEWDGKPEQEQLIISQAQLCVSKGDPDSALAILNKVQPGQPNYHVARIKMAEIYIDEKRDKRMFASCYKYCTQFKEETKNVEIRELLQVAPTPASYAMLGDAFMSIQEPEEAISYYEQALKMQNKDALLAEKIGEAYVMSHLYAKVENLPNHLRKVLFVKAVNFYESTMNIYKDKKMRIKLAELLLKLGNLEKCERVLKQPLEQEPNPMDLQLIASHVQLLQLLSRVHQEKDEWGEAFDCLAKAKMLQLRLLTKNDTANNFTVKRDAAKICCLLAELHSRRRDTGKALEQYKEAITFHEGDIKSNLALANIFMSQNKLQLCNQQCSIVLAIERDNDEATLMMADLLYLKNEGDQAIIHFIQLLTRNPNHYHALARVIELSWRNGDAENAEKFLQRALESNPRAMIDAGYNYCKGLHEWFTGDPNGALQAFNRARRDSEWGEKAIYNMIEICLNPDNEIIGGEVLEHSEDGPEDVDRAMGTKTAEKFLKELRYKPTVDPRYSLMENFILMHTGNKGNIQQALNAFLAMVGEGEVVSNVGAALGAARAYMLLKQVPKAKQILKRIIGHTWTLDNADYLEKCWLLLADLYINQNKPEQANNVLRTVLQHNASSLKAFEFQGYLREKDQKWLEAVQHYEKAWQICRQRNPAIGYKLAYNYFKCKRLFTCIETCHKVLDQYPHYPKIKKEIMDKARALIRT